MYLMYLIAGITLILSYNFQNVLGVEYTTEFELTLTDYQNPDGTLENGRRCDYNFLIHRDFCDPKFIVDVFAVKPGLFPDSWKSRILRYITPEYQDTNVVHNILSKKISLEYFPMSLDINIYVYDHDSEMKMDKIAQFDLKNIYPAKNRSKTRVGTGKSIMVAFSFDCMPNYYGERCTQYCRPNPPTWLCDVETGEYACSLGLCGHGMCNVDIDSSENITCICEAGWTGIYCNEMIELFVKNESVSTTTTSQPSTMLMIILGSFSTAISILMILMISITLGIRARQKQKKTLNAKVTYTKNTVFNGIYENNDSNHGVHLEIDKDRYTKAPGVIAFKPISSDIPNDLLSSNNSTIEEDIRKLNDSSMQNRVSDIYEEISEKSLDMDDEYEIPN